MLINLSNHPKENWQKTQTKLAIKLYNSIVNIPFPQITPVASVEEIHIFINQLNFATLAG